ncbi:MAG TPA: YdeI/OmpD-associated family protein [Lacunisphaera sp.]
MSKLRFRSIIEINGINPYVLVSSRRAAKLRKAWRKPMPVRIRVNGQPETPWSINLMPVGDGSFYLYLHGSVRKASKTEVGDVVAVEMEFDDDYKAGPAGHPMPAWFGEALDRNPTAKRKFEKLIPSQQKEILRSLARLKSVEAQTRNVERAIYVLSGGTGRFLGKAWNEG